MNKREIAIIGTGIMGRGIANNLSGPENNLRLFARNIEKIKDLESPGQKIYSSIADATAGAEFVILCLTEDSVVEDAVFRSGSSFSETKYVIDMGTTSPTLSLKLSDLFQKTGARFLDAPMTGSKNAARDGQILFMVGAKDKDSISEISFIFESCGKNVVYCGSVGDGQKAKIALNMVQAGIFQVYMEGFTLAKEQGISPDTLKEILMQSAAKSGIAEFKFPFVFSENYETHFSLKNMKKDLHHAISLAEQKGTSLPLCSHLEPIYEKGIRLGLSEKDYCSLNEVTARIRQAK